MKTKTDDYLEKILERFDERFPAYGEPYHKVLAIFREDALEFISKEFTEFEKRLRRELPDKEDENDRFFY